MGPVPPADYYDRNTRGFLRFGQGGHSGAIHRAVRGPGVPVERSPSGSFTGPSPGSSTASRRGRSWTWAAGSGEA